VANSSPDPLPASPLDLSPAALSMCPSLTFWELIPSDSSDHNGAGPRLAKGCRGPCVNLLPCPGWFLYLDGWHNRPSGLASCDSPTRCFQTLAWRRPFLWSS
jgi:hypothetical protein